MTREVTIAAVQLPAVPEGETNAQIRTSNFEAAEFWLDKAGQGGTDIACLGETFNKIGQQLTPENTPDAISGAVEEAIDRLGTVARRHKMVVIAPVLGVVDGVVRNIALVLDRRGE